MSDFILHTTQLPPEQQAIWAKCFHPTGIFFEFTKEEIEQSIPERFEKTVRRFPRRVAVKSKQNEFSYTRLNRAANCIAHVVLTHLGEEQEPVPLLFDNDAPIIAAVMGVLKSRKVYVPLDTTHPHARIAAILKNLRARLIVTDSKNLPLLSELAQCGCRVVNIDRIDLGASAENPKLSILPDSPAVILFTSGSTGQPKGVIQTHRNILHEIMNYANAVHICAADRLALLSSPSFADAVRTFYGAVLNGASLYPLNLKREGLTHLADWLAREEITIYRSVPSVFRHFADALSGRERFPHLRLIYSAGDSVTWADIESYQKHFSRDCIFVNGLGSTESLTYRWYVLDKETTLTGSSVPVGYTLDGQRMMLLDEQRKEIPHGEIGEIAVASRYLSPGYWNRPDLTQAAFQASLNTREERVYLTGDMGRIGPDGCLTHLGRKDFQVKIRGQRIEAVEIESALVSLKTIKEAVVVAREIRLGERDLVAYLVPGERPRPALAALRRLLAEKLPDYMIPSYYVWLDALPLNANKKVDRKALPNPDASRPEMHTPFVAPKTAVEEAIASIWSHVLGIDQVGIYDNFLDLGGHSLAATRIVSRVIKKFQLELPVESLFAAPTIAEMVAVIAERQWSELGEEETEKILAELESLTDEEVRRLLLDTKETGHGRD